MYRDPRTTKVIITAGRTTCSKAIRDYEEDDAIRNYEEKKDDAIEFWRTTIAIFFLLILVTSCWSLLLVFL